MATSRLLRPANLRPTNLLTKRTLSTSPFAPRHLLSIADLTPQELTKLILNAASHKTSIKSAAGISNSSFQLQDALKGQNIALMFTKRSTRTRVSTESAVTLLGGHPMFLGSQDIQLGVNESLMTSAIVARVDAHEDVASLAKYSSVPVINALSDGFHPLQTIADFLTVHEAFPSSQGGKGGLGLEGLKIAWVGDANNVLYDLAIGAAKLGVQISVATPKGYGIPAEFREIITSASISSVLTETNVPEEAVKNADIIVTDTWVSMGQEQEKAKRLKDFAGFQVTKELAQRGGAKEGWRFMHCLPRKPEEVSDEVFYSPASLVFPEAENRLWSALAVLEGFVVNKGKIV
ncbi:ornithine carbamoyltransferase [Recurvomyces mirabilis]|uniref:Ornithine carbamoyltransferase, mitochondrial n=1 Tax=Recurvomyces mirabilis TaxID=574656 RepID=A0AAE1C5D9_9PEZI|nr:ornithine carbamoyltransferase [Recurvomyces mirabilis]KAK5156627.1 ornithine carbamoyltransferase [Recurvomyces mirabilis]